MEKKRLKVNMLGTFSLSFGNSRINCDINRSRRVWLLLAYILYNHHRVVTKDELIDLLWSSDDKDNANPAGALKTTLHRVRSTLDILFPNAGHDIIMSEKGGYRLNPDIDAEFDIDEFKNLCTIIPSEETDFGVLRLTRALSLYNGEFLGKLSSDTWTIPISTYFSELYIKSFRTLMPLLYDMGKYNDAASICREALLVDPYQEVIYQHLMRNLIALNKREEALSLYEEMSKVLLSNFGVVPEPESRELYREALRTVNNHYVHPESVSEQLSEQGPINGALVCDYDFFKMLYQAEARLIARSGDAVHIAIFSMSAVRGKELSRKSLDYAMENLKDHLHKGLRKGDIVSQCSPCQFIVMLPHANYENSCMVCQRLIRAFSRAYPHCPARIDYNVQPMSLKAEPDSSPINLSFSSDKDKS